MAIFYYSHLANPNFVFLEVDSPQEAREIEQTYTHFCPILQGARYLIYAFHTANHPRRICSLAPGLNWVNTIGSSQIWVPWMQNLCNLLGQPGPGVKVAKRRAGAVSPTPSILSKLAPGMKETFLKRLCEEQ